MVGKDCIGFWDESHNSYQLRTIHKYRSNIITQRPKLGRETLDKKVLMCFDNDACDVQSQTKKMLLKAYNIYRCVEMTKDID